MNRILNKKGSGVIAVIVVIVIIVLMCLAALYLQSDNIQSEPKYETSSYTMSNGSHINISTQDFNILMSSENKPFGNLIKSKYPNVRIDYADTFEIISILNGGAKYDALMLSNSIWNYKIDSKVSLKNSSSIGITPIAYGIKKSTAEKLGFVDKKVYTRDIIDAINNKGLKFIMGNPTTTNSGASAYFALLYALADYPVVLTEENLGDEKLKQSAKDFFMGQERTVGNNDFLKESFLNGDYEAIVTYEHAILDINRELESQGKETLYLVYPYDGCAICDNAFAYIDNKNEEKLELFEEIQNYLLSKEGKQELQNLGMRTWYGGTTTKADNNVFNPYWGVDTTKYVNAVKFPSASVSNYALGVYQSQFRKPIHVVFCLDYSGSMTGARFDELRNAMDYILDDEKASQNMLQFFDDDIIDIIAFSDRVLERVTTYNGTETSDLLYAIDSRSPYGGTAIYAAAIEALEVLKDEDRDARNVSIILMTDGEANRGTFQDLKKKYYQLGLDIPIYSIVFGDAKQDALQEIANLTNGKIFDGKTDLINAFKEVRGYN